MAPAGSAPARIFNVMQVTKEELNVCTLKLQVVCSPDDMSAGFDRALKQFAKRVKVPGFRPGLAPRSLVEQAVPPQDLMNAAADEVIRTTLQAALKEHEITPSDGPVVELKSFDRDKGECEYSAKVPLAPVVDLGEYHGLEAERPSVDVADEEVDSQLEELRQRSAKREAITDRGAAEGDIAVVNLKADGETGDGRTFMMIVGKTFPALDQALAGMVAEEMKSLDLDFPMEFQESDWAGKKLHCQLTVRSINGVRLPPMDDEFAKSMKSKDLEELRKRLLEHMQAAKQNMAQDYVNEQLLNSLVSKSTVHVPDTMWEAVANRRLTEINSELQQQKKTLEEYAKENGMTLEELISAWQGEAKTQVVRAVVVREIFTKEKMKLNNAILSQELALMAAEYGIPPQELFDSLKKNKQLHEVEFRAVYKMVVDLLNREAKISEMASRA